MNNVHIPNSSLAISRLGFGCARLFGGRELRNSAALIESALRCGIRHFDTAPAYGSEDLLGAVLAGARDVTVATKIGLPRFDAKRSATSMFFGPLYRGALRPLLARSPALKSRLLRIVSQPAATKSVGPKRRLHRGDVLRELDDSLRRLRRSTIDLYLLHEPQTIEITDELREVFISLQKDGLIRAFGLAYGVFLSGPASFGSVLQCSFAESAVYSHRSDAMRIYHGVVRLGLQSVGERGTSRTAANLIAHALGKDRASAVIFSASTSRQIHQVSEGVAHESKDRSIHCDRDY